MCFIAREFEDSGPPGPRIQAIISGLSATSERERKLLDEELRSDRELYRS
jgi:hypothetical protein